MRRKESSLLPTKRERMKRKEPSLLPKVRERNLCAERSLSPRLERETSAQRELPSLCVLKTRSYLRVCYSLSVNIPVSLLALCAGTLCAVINRNNVGFPSRRE